MRGKRLHRGIAARQLVPALRACLHAREATRDGRVDRLIVAQFEVQERLVDHRPPVAAIERIAADEVQRARHGAPLDECHDQQHALAHAFAQQGEGLAGEIGPTPRACAGVLIEMPEGVPVLGPDRLAAQVADLHASLRGGAFLADILALA